MSSWLRTKMSQAVTKITLIDTKFSIRIINLFFPQLLNTLLMSQSKCTFISSVTLQEKLTRFWWESFSEVLD